MSEIESNDELKGQNAPETESNEELSQPTDAFEHQDDSIEEGTDDDNTVVDESKETLEKKPTESKEPRIYSLKFEGDATEYFKIQVVNFALLILTFGFYFPYMKAQRLQYYYGHLSFEGNRFAFVGTGQEMFKGFLRGIVLLIIWFVLKQMNTFNTDVVNAKLINFGISGVFLLGILPVVVLGSARYRFSRMIWRGIRWKFIQNYKFVFKEIFVGTLLLVISFSLYAFGFQNRLRRIVYDNLKFGDIYSSFDGTGRRYLALMFGQLFLLFITFGLTWPILVQKVVQFNASNLSFYKDDRYIELEFFPDRIQRWWLKVMAHTILTIVTFGLYYPIAYIEMTKMIVSGIEVRGTIDLSSIQQMNDKEGSAMLDDLGDFAGFDIFF